MNPLGAGLPGWSLRVVVGLLAATMVLVACGHGLEIILTGLLMAVGVVTVLQPGSPAPTVLIAGVVLATVFEPGDPLRPEVLVLIPLISLTHIACALGAVLPANGRLHPAALRAPVRRFLLGQSAAFTLAGVAAVLPAGRVDPVVEVLGLLGVAGLVLLGVRLVRT